MALHEILAMKNSAQLAHVANRSGYQKQQIDFVEFAKEKQRPYSEKKYFKNDYGLNISLFNGVDTITHSFIKETEDDFIKWTRSDLNGGYDYPLDIKEIAELNRTGTWVDTYAPSYYTVQVGATFNNSVFGSKIQLYSLCDNRGGVWRFVVDGDTENPIDISTWREASGGVVQTIQEGLNPFEEHTVFATFLGADPLHPPTGGTARGWLSDDPTVTTGLKRPIQGMLSASNDKSFLYYASNRDFAFSTTYSAVTNFIPAHSGVASVTKITEPEYRVDGVVLDFATLENFSPIDWENEITITQKFYGVINSTNVVEVDHVLTIDSDGVITVEGVVEVLQNITAVNWYAPMLPLKANVLNKAVSSYGNIIDNTFGGANLIFDYELDDAISVCGIDDTNTDLIAAVSIDHIRHTNVQSDSKSDPKILWCDPEAMYLKVYNLPLKDKSLATGYIYRFYERFIVAKIGDIYNTVINLF